MIGAVGMATAFALVPEAAPAPARATIVEQLHLTPEGGAPEDTLPYVREETIRRGDTLISLIERLGCDDPEASRVLRSSMARQLAGALIPGRLVQARLNWVGQLQQLTIPSREAGRLLVLERTGETFAVNEVAAAEETRTELRAAEIKSSLFAAADEVQLPDAIAIQLAEIFGSEVDFHRDLRRGARFSVMYEQSFHGGRATRPGRVVAAEFTNDGKRYTAYGYRGEDGALSYYSEDGRSLKRAFLRSPLAFSRITSGYAMRFHPIHKTWRRHTGVDYGAPTGTSVRATGDGVVEFAGKKGGYGNLVILKHHGRYSTYYAHLSRFENGIRRGARVAQGQTIAYVGSTGWATGPHLHYEFRIAGAHTNPLSAAVPTAVPLDGKALARFREATRSFTPLLQLAENTLASID
jgi:murein DD-endopeptidase MepM/ murein hydrolase activator NlpD